MVSRAFICVVACLAYQGMCIRVETGLEDVADEDATEDGSASTNTSAETTCQQKIDNHLTALQSRLDIYQTRCGLSGVSQNKVNPGDMEKLCTSTCQHVSELAIDTPKVNLQTCSEQNPMMAIKAQVAYTKQAFVETLDDGWKMCDASVCTPTTQKSTSWHGYYRQWNRKHTMDFSIKFNPGKKISGQGRDGVGRFWWTGTFTGKAFAAVKHYYGAHTVKYRGTIKKAGAEVHINGRWYIGSNNAPFHMVETTDTITLGCNDDNVVDKKPLPLCTPIVTTHTSWTGYYRQFMKKHYMHFEMDFNPDNTVTGSGRDGIAAFHWSGSHHGDKVSVTKQYVGRHKVLYVGHLEKEANKVVFEGAWFLGRQSKRFHMEETTHTIVLGCTD